MQSRGLDNNHSSVDCYGYLRNLPPWVSLSINRGLRTMKTLTINHENCPSKDIDYISDVICYILAENHDIFVDSLSFDINVNYTEVTEEERNNVTI
jgi:hypothetical protein